MKNILISGASGNLGRSIVTESLNRRYHVAALTGPSGAEAFKDRTGVHTFVANLADEAEVTKVFEEINQQVGSITMGVLTVGGFAMGTLNDTDTSALEKLFRLNFLTSFHLARLLFGHMQNRGEGGKLVFIGARPAMHPEEAKEMVSYALSKSLIFRLAEIINEDGKEHGITSHVVVPGIIDTPQNRKAMPDADFKRWVRPEDIAANILHLDSPSGGVLRESVLKIYGGS